MHMAPPSEDSASGRVLIFTCHRPSAGRGLGERPLPGLRAVSWHHIKCGARPSPLQLECF